MAAAKLLILLALAATGPLFGCGAETEARDEENVADHEEEGVGESNDELRSAVACQERTDTAYDHGKPIPIQVVQIGAKSVAKPTAHAFLKMQAAAHESGVLLSLTSGFRTMAEQTRLFNCFKSKSCNGGNIAAPPGHSNHQNGLAVDVSMSPWLARNASRFGFVRTVPSEGWHFEFRGNDPGGPCSDGDEGSGDESTKGAGTITWVAPVQDSDAKNGFLVKAHTTDPSIVKVVYSQGTFVFGTSTAAATDFGLRYSFKFMGDKTLTVKGLDANGAVVAADNVDFTLHP